MNGVFPEEALLSPGAFVQEVFARNETWTWCLYSMARKHQVHLIEDALQEFYCAVFRKWQKIPKDSHAKMMASLNTMLRRIFIDTLRRERPTLYLDDLSPTEQPAGTLYHLCYRAYQEEVSERLFTLLSDRDYLIMQKRVEGYESREIAEILDVNPNYIDLRIHRMRKKLRNHFS